jgi:hypothetical protein
MGSIIVERIYVRDKNFMDEAGRTRIFHSVNLVCKDRSRGYADDWGRLGLRSSAGWASIWLGWVFSGMRWGLNQASMMKTTLIG